MANYKISDLPAAVSISGTDLFEIESTISKSATLSLVAQYVLANGTNITLTGGTVTSSTPLIDATQTWNNAGVAFTADKIDVTDTASAAGSLLLDRRVGGVSKFKVDRTGFATLASGIQVPYAFGTNWVVDSGGLTLGSAASSKLVGEAANTLAQRNGANAQAFRLYNTYTDGSNYELGELTWKWGSNYLMLRTEAAGTGSSRPIWINSTSDVYFTAGGGGSSQWRLNTSGHLLGTVDNTYDIGASGGSRPRNLYVGTDVFCRNTIQSPRSSVALGTNGQLAFEATDNSTITVKFRGSDGTTRSATILLT